MSLDVAHFQYDYESLKSTINEMYGNFDAVSAAIEKSVPAKARLSADFTNPVVVKKLSRRYFDTAKRLYDNANAERKNAEKKAAQAKHAASVPAKSAPLAAAPAAPSAPVSAVVEAVKEPLATASIVEHKDTLTQKTYTKWERGLLDPNDDDWELL